MKPDIRIQLLVGLLLALASPALASIEYNYSIVTSMTFQTGVLPTSGYAGIADARIKATALDTERNFGAGTLLKAGGTLAAGGAQSFLVSVDLSALPDSALIIRARLWLYQVSRVASVNAPILKLWRVYRPFTVGTGDSTTSTTGANGVTYIYRKSGVAWASSGAMLHGAAGTAEGSWNSKNATAAADTAVTTTTFVGADTLDTGAVASDTPIDPVVDRHPKGGTSAGNQYYKNTGWISLDITNLCRSGNNGAYVINGTQFLVTGDEDGFGTTGLMIFPSSDYVNTLSSYGGKVYRPKIVVEYFDPASATGGRRIIGSAGRGIQ